MLLVSYLFTIKRKAMKKQVNQYNDPGTGGCCGGIGCC